MSLSKYTDFLSWIASSDSTGQGRFRFKQGSIRLDEILTPSDIKLNTGELYFKDVSGVSTLFWIDDAEVEHNLGIVTPNNADYLVGTANAELTNEIVVGTTPGGELGNTWASPTVDTTHSGSAHHAESHTIASHNDTTATGTELETLTDGSNADALHAHVIGTGTLTTLKEAGVQVGGSDIVTLDFGAGFDLTESPDTEINITLDFSEVAGHDSFTDFVANEHINHTSVTLTAGAGMVGTGDISASRTFDVVAVASAGLLVNANDMQLDINSLVETTLASGDFLAFEDITGGLDKKVTFANLEATLDHDNLAGFVANEHIDHTSVTLTAGLGISGGGDISSNRSFALDPTELSTATPVLADEIVFEDQTDSVPKVATGTAWNSILDHDALLNFIANEHINHTSVTLTAGVGLSGGGDISANRTFTVDLNELTTEASIAAGDFLAMVDITDSGSGKITLANLEAILNHDSLAGFVANEHIDWTSTSSNFSTTGTAALGVTTITGNLTVDTPTLFVDSVNNRVGIGTTSPTVTLDVAGNALIGSGQSTGVVSLELGFGRTDSGFSFVDFHGDTTFTDFALRIIRNDTGANAPSDIIHRGTGDLTISTIEASAIAFDTLNAERLRITSSGDVGINTAAPNSLLDVQAGAGAAGTITLSTAELTVVDGDILGQIDFQAPLESSGTDAILVGASIWAEADNTFAADNNETELVFATAESETATEKMRLTKDGRLGIGTSTPLSPLSITSSQQEALRLDRAGRCEYAIKNTTINKQWINGISGAGNFFFSLSGTGTDEFLMDQVDGDVLIFRSNLGVGNTGNTGGSSTTGTFVITVLNGTAPVGGRANATSLYSADVSSSSELFGLDEAGNTPQLTPHPSDLLDKLPVESTGPYAYPWAYSSSNGYLGKKIQVDMAGVVKAIEELTGKVFVTVTDMPSSQILDWDDDQESNRLDRLKDVERAESNIRDKREKIDLETDPTEKAEHLKELSKMKVPEKYKKKRPPKWMRDRGVQTNVPAN